MPSHHPPHIFLNDLWYMITAATYRHESLLVGEQAKQCLRDALQNMIQPFEITLRAWVILDNHYHLLLKAKRGHGLPRFLSQLHGRTSRQLNALDDMPGRQIWHNYWDTAIRTETDLWTRFNYIHMKSVKHGYVEKSEDWLFSSYHYFLRTRGEQWLVGCFARYPVSDFLEGDAFSNVQFDSSPAVERKPCPEAGQGRPAEASIPGVTSSSRLIG